jgi:hypothetical protein
MKHGRTIGLVLVTALAGCSHAKDIPGRAGTAERPDAAVQYATVRNDLALVVWSAPGNVKAGVHATSGAVAAPDRVTLNGSRDTGDTQNPSTHVTWSLVTADGVSGDVTVNDRRFRLENGGIFVIAGTDVTQVRHALAGLRPSDDTWTRLATEVPEIEAFSTRPLTVARK